VAKPDCRLIAALLVPLMIWPWVPVWNEELPKAGLFGAVAFVVSFAALEEVLFRGFLQGWLLGKSQFNIKIFVFSRANLITSIAFAVAHIWTHSLELLPGYFLVGMVLGYFRERYNGILVPVFLHSYYNLGLLFIATF
jgi:membrane protease YdiL (CAAX protease family)